MSFCDDIADTDPAPAPDAPDPLESFPAFIEHVRARLEAGRREYGDRSFERPTVELLGELQQEALDLAGWGFVLWARLEALRSRVAPDERPVRLVGADRGRRGQ